MKASHKYVITYAGEILHTLEDTGEDAAAAIDDVLKAYRKNLGHSKENPVCLDYWQGDRKLRTLSPQYLR